MPAEQSLHFLNWCQCPAHRTLIQQKKIPLKNVVKAGTIYGSGTAEHGNTVGETLGNYAENIGSSIAANRIANRLGEKIFGRAAFPMTRNFVEQGIGTVTEKIYNNLYKNRYNSK